MENREAVIADILDEMYAHEPGYETVVQGYLFRLCYPGFVMRRHIIRPCRQSGSEKTQAGRGQSCLISGGETEDGYHERS